MIGQHDWTWGAEHELSDWDIRTELPGGCAHNRKDYTIVNSNGIANDPKGKTWHMGGEINTPPTDTIAEQVCLLRQLKEYLPFVSVNYRSNLHLHVRIPGLGEDLTLLKRVQRRIHKWMPVLLPIIQPLPRPTAQEWPNEEVLAGAVRRWKRCRVSHQTLLKSERLTHQLEATTVAEFFDREPPMGKNGKPQWQFQPRLCVNLRQLKETDTVEFRHFFGTLNGVVLSYCFGFVAQFMLAALAEDGRFHILEDYCSRGKDRFPQYPTYDHRLDLGFRATTNDHSIPKARVLDNIQDILRGDFYD